MSKQPHISEQLETRVENSKENSDSLFKIGIKESNDPMYGFDKLYEELLLKNEIDAGLKQVLENVDKQRTNRENVSNRIHVAKRKPMLQRSFVKPRYKVKVEHSEKKELMEQIKYMVQKNLMVKKKLGPKRTYMAERIHIVTLGGKILCFTDSSTEIRRLSQKKFSKLSKEMKKNIISIFRLKSIEMKSVEVIKSLKEWAKPVPEKKVLSSSEKSMIKWKDLFRKAPRLRRLFEHLILMICDKERLQAENVKLLSETIYLEWISILQLAVNQQRHTCNQKLSIKHFPVEFQEMFSDLASHQNDKMLQIPEISAKKINFNFEDEIFNFKYLIKREDFDQLILQMPNQPSIIYLIPSFMEYLQSKHRYQYPLKCLYMISAIVSCSYCPFFHSKQLADIARYFFDCLQNVRFPYCKSTNICYKIGEILNALGNKIPCVKKAFLQDFRKQLANPCNNAYNFCCAILVTVESMGATAIKYILQQNFKKIAEFAEDESRYEFYFLLLDVCEHFITDFIEKGQTNKDSKTDISIASNCFDFFKSALILRLSPAFRKYEKRLRKIQNYNKKDCFPFTYGYINPEKFILDFLKTGPKFKKLVHPKRRNYCFDCEHVLIFNDYRLGCVAKEKHLESSSENYNLIKTYQSIPQQFLDDRVKEINENMKTEREERMRRSMIETIYFI